MDNVLHHGTQVQKVGVPFFLGLLASYTLWGIQTVQGFNCYISYRRTDSTWLKSAIVTLFVLDGIQSICITDVTWRFTFSWQNKGDINLLNLGWGAGLAPLLDTLITMLVHMFYIQSIWRLLGSQFKPIWTAVVLLPAALQVIGGIGSAITVFSVHCIFRNLQQTVSWGTVWLVSASVTDIVIAVLMSRALRRLRTGRKQSGDIISKLIQLVGATGLLIATAHFVNLAAYLAFPARFSYVFFVYIMPKLYINSMMVFVNSCREQDPDALEREDKRGSMNTFPSGDEKLAGRDIDDATQA